MTGRARFLENPLAAGRPGGDPQVSGPQGGAPGGAPEGAPHGPEDVLAFHRRLPGYAATPLVSLPAVAERLGVGELVVKCESVRFGLPSFKMLGASWATYRALCERLGHEPDWHDVDELAKALQPLLPFTLAAATDGNHGRAVARMARWLGLGATIFVPEGTTQARIDGIASEGATVTVVDGGYDDAVSRSAQEAGPNCIVISDTSWPGYTDVPRAVIEGYATLFTEVDAALRASSGSHGQPDVVMVPVGVGALACATVRRYAWGPGSGPGAAAGAAAGSATVLAVEPTDAACMTASALAGHPVTLEEPQHSVMAGLNCGTPSIVAWPEVSAGLRGFITIDDEWTFAAMRELASCGVEAGETGAAALAGLHALREQGATSPLAPLVGADASVLVLVTEGASDPAAWRAALGVELLG